MNMLEHSRQLSTQMETRNTEQLTNIVENSTQVNSPRAQDHENFSSPLIRIGNFGDDSVNVQHPADGLDDLSFQE